MKFTIALTKADREEIESDKENIAARVAEISGANSALNRLLRRQAALGEEIADLESASPNDGAAVKKLSEKRVELDLCNRRIQEIPPTNPQAEYALRVALGESTRLIVRLLLPCHQAYVAGVIKAIRPYCTNDGWAQKLANDTQAVQLHAARLWRDYRMGNPVAEASEVLRRYDEILSGSFEWEFDPKLS